MVCSPGGRLDGGFLPLVLALLCFLLNRAYFFLRVKGKPEKCPHLLVLIGKIN